jgi:DUF1680 family protein
MLQIMLGGSLAMAGALRPAFGATVSKPMPLGPALGAPGNIAGWSVAPFALGEVQLSAGSVFQRAVDEQLTFARNFPTDSFLTVFRVNAGLQTSATPAPPGGWEGFPNAGVTRAITQQWGPAEYPPAEGKNSGADGCLRGHYGGHALTMLAMTYAATQDATILAKLNAYVTGMKECRDALALMTYNSQPRYSHPGFFSAYGEWQFSALEAYAPYGEIWAPYYTLHKILQGLTDAYRYAGSTDALDIAEGIGHWVYSRLSKCTTAQLQRMWGIYIGGEYGGMNDALIDLYLLSSDPDKQEFFDAAKLFDLDTIIDSCANGQDVLNGKHANQHIPQITGYAKLGVLEPDATARARYLAAAAGFFGQIVPGRMYAHGGTGEGEMWGPANTVAGDIGSRNAESCAAYNMLKVARTLFFADQQPKYMDYYERTLLNHILGGRGDGTKYTTLHNTTSRQTPGNLYMYPVGPGQTKEYGTGNIGTCCGGTALESHSKYQDSIYFYAADGKALWVNLFMPSVVTWADAGLTLKQETSYPEDETSVLTIQQAPIGEFSLKIRIPGWCTGATVKVGAGAATEVAGGQYYEVKRTWSAGDTVTLNFPMQLRTEATVDRPDIQSLMYGPTVLNGLSSQTTYLKQSFYKNYRLDGTMGLAGAATATPNTFIVNGITYEPAYNGNNDPYHMYFQVAEDTVAFAGVDTGLANVAKSDGTTLLDAIWAGAPFADKAAFLRQVQEVTKAFQDDGLISLRARQEILVAAGRARMA